LFGLSLLNGSVLPGLPVNVADALLRLGTTFTPLVQNQRGALAIADSVLYVPYGGHAGDCGQYHGTVLGVPLLAPSAFTAWITRGLAGGIWAPGGISFDGQSLYIATGNTMGASEWADGEAVIRLPPALSHSDQPQDFFAPSDWQQLDAADADLGGSNPLPLDVPGPGGTSALIMALGKDGKAYLLDRTNLGGIGGSLVEEMVANAPIRTAPVRYSLADSVLVAFQAEGSACPASAPGSGLVALRVQSGPPPSLGTAWCAPLNGHGNPIVTTTDGISDPIVWVVGAEGDNRLHGFRGDTGEPIFAGGGPSDAMAGLRHFVTILAAQGRLYVAADGQIYAFTY
jgi:hypothetical protein